jgi:ligand-binding sensor domain-containing protein
VTGSQAFADHELGGIAEYSSPIAEYRGARVLEPPAAFAAWTTFVSHAAVRAMAVAPVSRITWIATWAGVLAWDRRDEYVYRRYSSEHGLAGTPTCIAIADDDRPWVGHLEGGLSFFDNGRWHPYGHLRNDRVLAIAAGRGTTLWVATREAIFVVARDARPVELVRGDGRCSGATALLDDNGGVLVATASGVFRVSERAPVQRFGDDALRDCTSLARAQDGTVVVGTTTGVVFADGSELSSDEGDSSAIGIAATRRGLWVLTHTGIARIEDGRWQTIGVPEDVAAPRAIAVGSPNDEHLWIGTDNLVCGLRPTGDSWNVGFLPGHAEDVLCNAARCVAGGWGAAYVGTANGLFIGKQDGTWSFEADLVDVRSVVAISVPGRESLWVLTWPGGVMHRSSSAEPWVPVSLGRQGLPRALVESWIGDPHVVVGSVLIDVSGEPRVVSWHVPTDARGVIHAPEQRWFAATDRGLFEFDNNGSSLVSAIGSAPVSALGTAFAQLWVGVPGALWTLVDDQWEKITLSYNGEAWSEPVTAIASSKRADTLWCACGGRVARVDIATGTVLEVHDRFDSGICGEHITGLAEVEGRLWVVSRAGIARYQL